MSTQTISPQGRQFEHERYVPAEVAAAFLGCSEKTLRRMARAGTIPAHPFGEGLERRHWRFLISELDDWMRSRNNVSVHQRRVEGRNNL
jgi:excisionase family DNA binding protein